MKTDICTITNGKSTYNAIFTEVDKSAEYNKLEKNRRSISDFLRRSL